MEDDYLSDFDSRRELTFHYLDDCQQVIYIKSFSTSLFPALRITALLLPPGIKETFIAYKSAVDYDSNLIMQKALSLYIDSLMFEKNRLALLQLQEREAERAQQLADQAQLALPVYPTKDGLLLDLRPLPSVSALKHSGLPLDFFETSYASDCPYHYAKLAYDGLEENLEKLKNRMLILDEYKKAKNP
ncbi:putative transcriptional regulator of pyridoxine metabolism [Streptococcus sp. DD11]|nr:putative transcriptional regulator of pyridoxine metabolism [Streptococcus sp. DD11]